MTRDPWLLLPVVAVLALAGVLWLTQTRPEIPNMAFDGASVQSLAVPVPSGVLVPVTFAFPAVYDNAPPSNYFAAGTPTQLTPYYMMVKQTRVTLAVKWSKPVNAGNFHAIVWDNGAEVWRTSQTYAAGIDPPGHGIQRTPLLSNADATKVFLYQDSGAAVTCDVYFEIENRG